MNIEPQNNELHIEYFPNGKKQCEGNFSNQKREGKWTFWNEQGKKISEGHYKNGVQHLQWIILDEQGRKVTESYYEGKKHGLWNYWDDKGREIIETHHKNGNKNGLWHYYDNDGNVRIENYIDGKKNGSCRYICPSFYLTHRYSSGQWDKSELIKEILAALQGGDHLSNNLMSLFYLKEPILTELELNYIDDKKNGLILLKFSGEVIVEGSYKNDKKHKSWIGFGANGGLASWIEYWDDKIQSDETERYKKEIEEKELQLKHEKRKKEQLEKQKEGISKSHLTGDSSSAPIFKFDAEKKLNNAESETAKVNVDAENLLKNTDSDAAMVNVAGINISKSKYKRLKRQGLIFEKEKNIFKRFFGL